MSDYSVREWIIEFDFDANEMVSKHDVQQNLSAEMYHSQGFVELKGNTLICDEIDDAFAIRMRFADNIIDVREQIFTV